MKKGAFGACSAEMRCGKMKQEKEGARAMKLNGDILFDALVEAFVVKKYGHYSQQLTLPRPRLYGGWGREFEENRLYIAQAGQLPGNPIFREGAVVICVGSAVPAIYTSGNYSCLVVESGNLISVNNAVLDIFDRFDAWDRALRQTLETTADIQKMLEVSFPIFENPMVVIDSEFHFLAYSAIINRRDDLALFRPDENNMFQKQYISLSLRNTNYNTSRREPFLMICDGNTHFSVNLYQGETYIGNLKIAFVLRPFRAGDNILCQYFAKLVEQAMTRLHNLADGQGRRLERVFRMLLQGNPLSNLERQFVTTHLSQRAFQCMKLVRGKRARRKVPLTYFTDQLEKTFPGSAAFEYDGAIVAMLCQSEFVSRQRLLDFLRKLDLNAGLSNVFPFSQASQLRYFYRQACIALEIGASGEQNERLFCFREQTLTYLLFHALGEFPLALFDTTGFQKLVEHNRTAQVDYIETLDVYLKNERNLAKTAKELYIHRSTLMDRLARIASLLDVDLDDADQRLELMIIERVYRAQNQLVPAEEHEDKWSEENPLPAAYQEPQFRDVEKLL